MNGATIIKYLGVFVLFVLVFSLAAAVPTMLLWNWICPQLFHLTEITFSQSWGLLMLCSFLFKSSGFTSRKSN